MIREYAARDLPELLSVWESASAIAHPFLAPEFIAAERENIPNLYLPNTETWVAEQEGRVVGFISLMGDEVAALFVTPDHQRHGIGHALLGKAQHLRGDLVVEVFAANSIGRGFYHQSGFTPLAESIHEPTGQSLIRMVLPST